MSENNNTSAVRNITLSFESMGFITFIVFLILKLTNVINWSWFWVIFPLWIPLAVGLLFLGIIFLIVFLVAAFSKD